MHIFTVSMENSKILASFGGAQQGTGVQKVSFLMINNVELKADVKYGISVNPSAKVV